MNGYIVISLENGLMLFTHTNNNYGLSEPKEPLEISSYLYAVYTLSKSWYDDHDDIQRDEILNESIITSFRESPLSYFQQVLYSS